MIYTPSSWLGFAYLLSNDLNFCQVIFENRKEKWEKLKSDTNTKLDLLGENRVNSACLMFFVLIKMK